MFYDLSNDNERREFWERCQYLANNQKKVDLTEKRQARTIRQNKYLHLIFGWYGVETGYTATEVKEDIFKRDICRFVFERVKNSRVVYRSTADLDTREMSLAIDAFRNHASAELNIYLPAPRS